MVLVYALLAIIFFTLPCYVFLVYNTGHQINRKIETQNAADSAAVSGAGQVARSLNLAAMNNIETLRLLTVIQILDAMPDATAFALTEQRLMLRATQRHRALGIPGNAWLSPGLERVEADLNDQLDRLEQLNEMFERYSIGRATRFRGPDGQKGDLWKSIDSLQALSRAAMENVGTLAQLSAVRAAQENQSSAGAQGFLVPFVPSITLDEDASFDDFRRPFVEGRLPLRLESTDRPQDTRGPWDALYGWRDYTYNTTDFLRPNTPAHGGYASELFLFNPISTPRRLRGEVVSYSTQAAFTRFAGLLLQATVDGFGTSAGYDRGFGGNRETWVRSWFYAHTIGLAREKANFLFGPDEEGAPAFPSEGYVVLSNDGNDSNWISEHSVAQGFVQTIGGSTNARPRPLYLWLEFDEVEADALWQPIDQPPLFSWGIFPFRARLSNWLIKPLVSETNPDAPFGNVGSIDTLTRAESRREVTNPVTGNTKRYIRYLYFVWCGLNVGTTGGTTNPNPPLGTPEDELPKPVLFLLSDLSPDDAQARRDRLTFLAAAEQPTASPLLGSLFDADRPTRSTIALAQAKVFNTHSWDGFTPMWHAQLTDVDDLDGWLDTMQRTGSVTNNIDFLDPDRIGEVFRSLRIADPLLTEVMKP